ncbi:DEAD/DEAH box helicase [Chloroflexi bacterium TSY]|nr:DEAD/DEAH box helicase [Chloroflexi bacterium TSY]
MPASVFFQGGTLVLNDVSQTESVHPAFQWVKSRWRCEAYRYGVVEAWLLEQNIRNWVPRWKNLALSIQDNRQPHDYQTAALTAWDQASRRGSIVLPTGAGKTFVASQAIQLVARSTVIIAPTIDLLHQWYARLKNAFGIDIGVYYGAEKQIEPITVTTYHSAGDLIADVGNQFKLIIFDEVHHLPAPSWGETALMTPAPYRLGLTATYPDPHEQQDGRWRISDLIGPIVYQKPIDELVGTRLAEYRTERIYVNLTLPEQRIYDGYYGTYADFFRSRRLPQTHGPNWLLELMRLSAFDIDARQAFLARQQLQRLLAGAEEKLSTLDRLLREHHQEQILIFTDNNDVVYRISRRHLLPALTHETKAEERRQLLEAFRNGQYKVLVTSKVLNEGVDVPEAKVAIVLGGSAGAREYIQRLGRVLRKVGNREAILYEVIVRNTVDAGRAQRRRPQLVRQIATSTSETT